MATPATGVQANSRLDELYRAHAADIYRYVYAVLGNRADAEDVTQTTFMNALRALERGELPRKPENWLITIAHNLIRQRFRQQYLRPRQVELDSELPTLEADDNGPSLDDLVRALQRIPPAQREALVLRELEGRSYKEIASILDVSLPALEGLIFRARRSLAEELENLVTCDRAELALSQRSDGRLGRKERRRLAAHLAECTSCARVATLAMKRRRAFKGLALLPLPVSLTLFKGAPSASAAVGLPSIGAAAAGGGAVAGTGLAAKLAVGAAAVAVASGAGYEGVKVVSGPATPARPAKTLAAPVTPATAAAIRHVAPTVAAPRPAAAKSKPVAAKPKPIAAKSKPIAKKPKPIAAKAKPIAKKPKAVAITWNPVVKKAKLERTKPVQTSSPPRSPTATQRVKPVRAVAPAKDRAATAPVRESKPTKEQPAKEQRAKRTRDKSDTVPRLREKVAKPR